MGWSASFLLAQDKVKGKATELAQDNSGTERDAGLFRDRGERLRWLCGGAEIPEPQPAVRGAGG